LQVIKAKCDAQLLDLLAKMLVYNPQERVTPLDALAHPYFNELRATSLKINGNPVPDLFNFTPGTPLNFWLKLGLGTTEELSAKPEMKEQLVPKWYTEFLKKKQAKS
jgi:serine/threonine protein kinase